MTTEHSMSDRSKLIYATLAVIGACLILLLIAEGAIRARAFLKYGYVWGVEDTFQYDSDIDLRLLKAGTEFGPIRINDLGFRGPDIVQTEPDERIRIAFLGGSTTFCAEVSSNEMTWPHLVWKAVKMAGPGAKFDYINGGVPGYGLDASIKNLNYKIAQLNPDVIVIYHATNDLSANSFDAAREQGLVEHRSGQRKFWLSKYSLLSHLVEMNLRIRQTQRNVGATVGVLEVDAEQLTAPFREDLTRLVQLSNRSAKIVALVTFSSQMRKEQSAGQKAIAAASSLYYMPYMSPDGLVEAFSFYNDVIREVAFEQGVLLIDAEHTVPGDDIHFNDSVHFTDAGSRVMAEIVAKGLLASDQFSRLVEKHSTSRE